MTAFFRIDITVDAAQTQRIFTGLARNLLNQNIEDWLRDEIDPYIRGRIERRFANQGDDVVGAWLPLAPATERIRAAKGFPPSYPINERTHYMRDWLVGYEGDVTATAVDVTLTHPAQAAAPLTQQKIATAQGGKSYPQTPPRPVIGVNRVDNDFIHNALIQHLFRGL